MIKRIKRIIFLLFFLVLSCSQLFSESLTFVSFNVWSGLDYSGFFKCKEKENSNDKIFRQEIVLSGLKKIDADIMCLNGINPAKTFSASAASFLDLDAEYRISRSGIRIASVSLPINLQEGDALFFRKNYETESCGRIAMNSLISTDLLSFFSRNGAQVFGRKINTENSVFFVFSINWSESFFDNKESLNSLVASYSKDDIEPELFYKTIKNAVEGSKERKQQAEETLSFINSIVGELPVVIMGSFNALPESKEMLMIKKYGFSDVFEIAGRGKGFTLEEENKKYRTDYILVRGDGVVPLSAEIVMDEPVYNVYPSRKYGVKAVIEFPSNLSAQ